VTQCIAAKSRKIDEFEFDGTSSPYSAKRVIKKRRGIHATDLPRTEKFLRPNQSVWRGGEGEGYDCRVMGWEGSRGNNSDLD
jgi:hypothetical protein